MISILLPTSKRQDLLRNMLQSLKDTTQGFDIEVIAVIDDDPVSYEIVNTFDSDELPITVDYSSKMRGALWAWNRALQLSDGEYITPCGDDQLFYPNWLEYALESHKDKVSGNGVVGMNDLAYDGNTQVATMFLFDRAYCKEHMGGIVAPPMYNYYCIDLEWNEKAKILGKYFWDSRSIVEHLHTAHGKREYDMHDKLKEDNKWMEADNITFENRKARKFPIEWTSLL